jgi:hypothetical protein
MPLPDISADEPSAFVSSNRNGALRPGRTRITPSAPAPSQRSHNAETSTPTAGPSSSSMMRKSFPDA